jgi:hypothetical protein
VGKRKLFLILVNIILLNINYLQKKSFVAFAKKGKMLALMMQR